MSDRVAIDADVYEELRRLYRFVHPDTGSVVGFCRVCGRTDEHVHNCPVLRLDGLLAAEAKAEME